MTRIIGSNTVSFFERLSSVLHTHASLGDFQAGTVTSCRSLLAGSSEKIRNMLLDGSDSELVSMLLSAGSEIATYFVQLIHGMEVTLSNGAQIFDLCKLAHITQVAFIEEFCVSAISSGKYTESSVLMRPSLVHLDSMRAALWSSCESEDASFCDASILTPTTSFEMHRIVLASASERFCEIFVKASEERQASDLRPAGMTLSEPQSAVEQQAVFEVVLESDAETVRWLQEFIYQGQVLVETLEGLCRVLSLAEEWQFVELKLATAEAAAREIVGATLQSADVRLQQANLERRERLVQLSQSVSETPLPAADAEQLPEPSGVPTVLDPGRADPVTAADAEDQLPAGPTPTPYWRGLARRLSVSHYSSKLPRNRSVEPVPERRFSPWDDDLEYKPPEIVSVKVTHVIYGLSIEVQVHRQATILELRQTILHVTGATNLEDILLLKKNDPDFVSLFDGDQLQGETEFHALGFNSVCRFPDDVAGSGAFPLDTLELINKGQALRFTEGRAVGYGETLRVQAKSWGHSADSIAMFYINLESALDDCLLNWCAIPFRQHVVRQSKIKGSFGWRTKETCGGWPHGECLEHFTIDFERSPLKWKVSINGIRKPDFDYAHRSKADVTKISLSANLVNAQVFVLKTPRQSEQPERIEALMRPVNVIHAINRKSVRVLIPKDATVRDVQQQVLRATGSTRNNELVLVQDFGSGEYFRYPEEDRVDTITEFLALGCNAAFQITDDTMAAQFAGANVADQPTHDLLALRLAFEFKGDRLRLGDTIRVEADGWNGVGATTLNTFMINLVNGAGDIALHWGARYNLQTVVRNTACKVGTALSTGLLWSAIQEDAGGWPHGTVADHIMVDFTLTPLVWKVSVNGVRLRDFDFAHRVPTDVKEVKCSDNLVNARVVLIPRVHKPQARPEGSTTRTPPRVVQVTHAIYGASTRVFLPRGATLLHVREQVVKEAGSARTDEVILVEQVGSTFYELADDQPVEHGQELMALGCCSTFKAALDEQDPVPTELLATRTSELLATGQAQHYEQGRPIRNGYTIRFEAEHWNASCASPLYEHNSFYINLLTNAGDIAFHWGARLQSKCIARNSRIDGLWSIEEQVGDWPHCDVNGSPTDHVQIEFTRTPLKWNVSVNGRRVPDFDFAQRVVADVTRVTWSDNIVKPTVILIPPVDSPELAFEAGMRAKFETKLAHQPMKQVKVVHAVYQEYVRVYVPPFARLLAVRQQVLLASASNFIDEVLLVRPGDTGGFALLPDDEPLGDRDELLALGCSQAFAVADESELLAKQVASGARVQQLSVTTEELLNTGQARFFQEDDLVFFHETIRFEADGWSESFPSALTKQDTFYIDLERSFGDVVLHWGARFYAQQVVRDSQSDARWCEVEETSGGWPHGCALDKIRIDFMRARHQWKVSINGVRRWQFDFAHRGPADVTNVSWSENLINARVVIISAPNAPRSEE